MSTDLNLLIISWLILDHNWIILTSGIVVDFISIIFINDKLCKCMAYGEQEQKFQNMIFKVIYFLKP